MDHEGLKEKFVRDNVCFFFLTPFLHPCIWSRWCFTETTQTAGKPITCRRTPYGRLWSTLSSQQYSWLGPRNTDRQFSTLVILAHCLVCWSLSVTRYVCVTHEYHLYLDCVDLDHYACMNGTQSIHSRSPTISRGPQHRKASKWCKPNFGLSVLTNRYDSCFNLWYEDCE